MLRKPGLDYNVDMIKSRLSLAASLLLAVSPVFAQIRAAVDGRIPDGINGSGTSSPYGSVAPSAIAPGVGVGLTAAPSLSAAALPALAAVEAAPARPAALAALAADPSPAAAFVRAAAAAPAVLADPALRAQAVASLGAGTVARVEAAVRELDRAASTNMALAADLADLRAKEGASAHAHARTAMDRIARELGAMRQDGDAVAAGSGTGASTYRLSKPSRALGAVRRAAAALTLSLGLLNAAPVIAQTPAHQPGIVLTQAAVPAQAPAASVRQEEFVRARDINDAIAQWHPGVNLIVIGDVGLSQGALRDLNAALAGKHWTVLLVEDASGMRFVDVDGNTRYDLDAVQYGIGQGIFRKQGFSGFVNPQTGERDGSLFAITLHPKNLYLRNSEAQKNHGLYGETEFKGDLDQWAIANMRSGGDIVGAVKETVENIDTRLTQAIAAEASDARTAVADAKTRVEELAAAQASFVKSHASASRAGRADVAELRRQAVAAEASLAAGKNRQASAAAAKTEKAASTALSAIQSFETSYASAQSELASAASAVDALDKAATTFREEHPKAAGALARPDVAKMRETLKSAKAAVETDPSAAVASAKSAAAQARAASDAIAAHAAGAGMIDEAAQRLAALEKHAYRSAATDDVVSAKQAIGDARELWANGDAGWSAKLNDAKAALGSAEHKTAAAADAARTNAIIFWGLLGLLTLLTGGLAFWLNRRARAAAAKAQEVYDAWDTGLAKKSNANIDKLMEKVQLYAAVSGQYARSWTGESQKVAAQIRADSGRATLLLSKAKEIHARANALLHPKALSWGGFVNAFWPSRAQEAVRLLQDEPITFDPKEAETLFGVEKGWREDLLGDVKTYQAFKKSFTDVIAEFNEKAAAAMDAVEKLEHAVTKSGEIIDGAVQGLKAVADRKAAIASAADGLFAAPSLFEKAVPAGEKLAAEARETVKTDPMSGVYGAAAEAQRIATEGKALLDAIDAARVKALAGAYAAEKALSERGVAASWIKTDAQALSAEAEKIAAAVVAGSVAESVKALTGKLDDLGARASRAAEIARKIDDIVHNNADKAETAIVAARAEVGRILGLDPEKTLREDGADPSDRVSEARRLAAEAKKQLAAGTLDAADASGASAAKNADEASAIAAASLESLRTQERVSGDRRAESQRLDGLTKDRAAVLKSIVDQFAPSVLDLGAGDVSHPNANGTVSDNVEEAEAAIAAAKSKTEQSAREFKAGRVLKAASLLAQAKAHQEIAQARLDEIAEKRDRLDKAVKKNAVDLAALNARTADEDVKVAGDKRTMQPTLAEYADAKKKVADASALVGAKKGDPFKAAAALAAAAAELEHVWVAARNDFDAYAHLQTVIQSAKNQMDKTGGLVREAHGDGVAPSPAIQQAYRDHDRLVAAYGRATQKASADHADWPSIDREISGLLNESAHVAATLSGELAAAARATQSISSAASKVSSATGWRGSYGVYIPGSPGSGDLSNARAAINNGDYAAATRYAEAAAAAAVAAIAAAEAEVARKRREEEEERRRQEEERRRRQREEEERRNNSGGGGSSWGGSSSGGGGSSWGSSSSGGGSSSW